MDKQSEDIIVKDVKGFAKFFKVSVKIELFGHTVFEWVWPPQKS